MREQLNPLGWNLLLRIGDFHCLKNFARPKLFPEFVGLSCPWLTALEAHLPTCKKRKTTSRIRQ